MAKAAISLTVPDGRDRPIDQGRYRLDFSVLVNAGETNPAFGLFLPIAGLNRQQQTNY
ncbi:MAG TPA: hypothetical protein VK014_08095 [Cyclobacteriaceae bacterium]|nr:hypothetical protein [Cyclobacteriaceae bacterium]